MKSRMAKSSTFEGFTSPAKGQAKKKPMMRRYGRRQLLKEIAGKGLTPTNPIGAKMGEEVEAEQDEEEEGEEVEIEEEGADEKEHSTGSDAQSEDVDNTSALQAHADKLTAAAADHGSDVEETGEASTMGPTTSDPAQSALVESSDDDETKESESLTTTEDDMYYIEAIKSSRVGKDGGLEFLIKWQGYEKKADLTWEPEKTLVESVSEILSEYLEKIGGRETIIAKRKRGRPSKTAGTDGSGNLPKAKKQKAESKKVNIIWNEGEGLGAGAGAAKEDQDGKGGDDGERTIPNTPALKKGRGRPPKVQGRVTQSAHQVLSGKNTAKKGPDCPPKSAGHMSSLEKPSTLKESSAKKGRGRPPKRKGPNVAQADESLVAKTGRGRPPKIGGSTPPSGVKTTFTDTPMKRGRGRPSKIKEPHSVEKESEEDHDDRESSALG